MKIILIVRRSKSYYLHGRVMAHMKHYQYAWDMFFDIPYIEFRRRLSDISAMSYMYAGFDKIYFWADNKIYEKVNKPGNVVLSIDEDDWISRSVPAILRDFDFDGTNVVMWRAIHLKCDNWKIFAPIYYSKWHETPSCAYAIRTPHDVALSRESWRMHYTSSREKHVKLDKFLSVKLDNYSSISFAERYDIDKLIEVMKNRYIVAPNEDLEEYIDQVEAYNNLLLELYDSCRV